MMASTAVEKKRVVIVGATGYIGKFVVKESIRRGLHGVSKMMTLSSVNSLWAVNGD